MKINFATDELSVRSVVIPGCPQSDIPDRPGIVIETPYTLESVFIDSDDFSRFMASVRG